MGPILSAVLRQRNGEPFVNSCAMKRAALAISDSIAVRVEEGAIVWTNAAWHAARFTRSVADVELRRKRKSE